MNTTAAHQNTSAPSARSASVHVIERQTRRFISTGAGTAQWPDTIATCSADVIGDEQAQRQTGWGSLDDCGAPECAMHHKPSKETRDDSPNAGWVVLIGVLCIAAVSACALIAMHLPRVPI